jgi:hypothetical protein
MKWILNTSLSIAIIIISIFSVCGQSQDKNTVLTGFFKAKGINVLSKWAHPSSTCYTAKAVININGSMIDLTLFYIKDSKKFSCAYTVILNPNCYFSRLTFVDGYPKNKCFSNCKTVENLQSNIKVYKGDNEIVQTVEGILHRTLKEFDCSDDCLLGLNYFWKANGYRAKYLGETQK